MADVPMFLFKDKKDDKKFIKETKADIKAVIDLLYKRGMWSRYHYGFWTAELDKCTSAEMLHLWWDSIVSGAMNEVESPMEERIEAMGEPKGECPMKGKK